MTNSVSGLGNVTCMTVLALTLAHSSYAATIRCGDGNVECLIAAINAANANGHAHNTIQLSGTYTAVDDLPLITSRLTIEAGGGVSATVTRIPSERHLALLHVSPHATLTLRRMTLDGADSVRGSLLFNDGVATVLNSLLTGSRLDAAIVNGSGLLRVVKCR